MSQKRNARSARGTSEVVGVGVGGGGERVGLLYNAGWGYHDVTSGAWSGGRNATKE